MALTDWLLIIIVLITFLVLHFENKIPVRGGTKSYEPWEPELDSYPQTKEGLKLPIKREKKEKTIQRLIMLLKWAIPSISILGLVIRRLYQYK